MVKRRRNHLDWIIGIGLNDDCPLRSDFFDGIILVVRYGRSSRSVVKTALESLEGENIIGILFNGMEKQLSSNYYYGYYDKYYTRNEPGR